MNKKRNRKGFTIVELAIVIAIIAILAVALIPTFSGILDKAKKTELERTLSNEYAEYVMYAGAEAEENVVIYLDDEYYQITNGIPDIEPMDEEPDAYWNGDSYINAK